MIDRNLGQIISDAAWAALLAGHASNDFYAVITTGIVCRHGCPARTPLRKNVRLFASVNLATVAGFRACKRCKPTDASPENSRST